MTDPYLYLLLAQRGRAMGAIVSAFYFYVCDHCGELAEQRQIPEGAEWTCAKCGDHRAWEFPPERALAAVAHSAHIQDIAGPHSIFRRVR